MVLKQFIFKHNVNSFLIASVKSICFLLHNYVEGQIHAFNRYQLSNNIFAEKMQSFIAVLVINMIRSLNLTCFFSFTKDRFQM